MKVCICCGHNGSFYPIDREHTKTKGSGGSDLPNNVSLMCRKCHTLKGMKGVLYMSLKYPSYKNWLEKNGWELCPIRNKWFLPI